MLEDEHEILGVQSRVGSFDDEMYRAIYGEYINPLKRRKAELIHEALQRLEAEEQRIADSHDITKSSFGFDKQ